MPSSHYPNPISCKHSPITVLSPAKINLFLHITGRRLDGYHDLQTVFRQLDWGDTLSFFVLVEKIGSITQAIEINSHQNITSNIEDNLIFKAAQALLQFAQEHRPQFDLSHLPKVRVVLDKHIPMGAGLGGGSSNAAMTLLTLNQIWQLHFDVPTLIKIATKLGADVPFFIYGQDAIAEGIGEQLYEIKLPKQTFLLLMPDDHINTAQLFAHPQLNRQMPKLTIADIQKESNHYLYQKNERYLNVFEPIVCELSYPVKEALAYLQSLESATHTTARMTGSGSCVFLPIPPKIAKMAHMQAWINEAPCLSRLVTTP